MSTEDTEAWKKLNVHGEASFSQSRHHIGKALEMQHVEGVVVVVLGSLWSWYRLIVSARRARSYFLSMSIFELHWRQIQPLYE